MFSEIKFKKLEELDKEIVLITHLIAVLEYDLETAISEKGTSERSSQIAWVSKKLHNLISSKEMGLLLKDLGACEENFEGYARDDFEKALIRVRYENYRRAIKIPTSFIDRKELAIAKSYSNWAKAREKNDFSLFKESLTEVVNLSREEASYIKEKDQSLYDALLNCYEKSMTSKELDSIFNTLEKDLSLLIEKYKDIKIEDSFLYQEYSKEKQEKFARKVLKDMNFDESRGVLSLAIHPFTSTLGSDDIRITTRYDDPSIIDPLSSTVHEGGHALYEMNANSNKLKDTSLGEGISMGFHESQSRFYENIILRSSLFWKIYYKDFKKLFPKQLENISETMFVKAINQVKPSFIRCNADEVTYNLHIILRYKIEKALIEGSIEIDDLPSIWNKEFEKLFKIKVDKISNGCLQDVHWASGLFGYFPTYALGNLYSAQIYSKMIEDFGGKAKFEEKVLEKGISEISEYLNEKVHSQGCLYVPCVLIKNITNKTLDGNYFTEYLKSKLITLL